MRVAERMRRHMALLDPRDSIARAAQLLAEEGVRAIPVVRRSALVRMLGETDVALVHPSAATTLSIGEIGGRLAQTPIGEVPPRGPLFARLAL